MKTANLAIVFTDIKGFTERTSRQTLEQNETLLHTHSTLLAPVFRAFGGRIIKEIGDAFLVTFESPTQAVLAGVALQDKLWAHNRGKAGDDRIDVRVAINCGEVRLENNDIFGEPVNIAARVEGLADAGEVYLTEAVYLSMNKAEVPSEEVGLFDLKGIPGKIRVFKVPHAPYRVAPAVAGTAAPLHEADAPPYGNIGLARMPDVSASRAMGEQLVKAVGNIDSKAGMNVARRVLPFVGALVAVFLLVSGVRWLFTSSVERAVVAVEEAGPADRKEKITHALALLNEEKNIAVQQYWSGRLQQARDDTSAFKHYVSAVEQGSPAAEERLVEILASPQCEWRVEALEAIGELKLKRATPAVAKLAETGGADDGKRTGFFASCNSKNTAAETLRKLE